MQKPNGRQTSVRKRVGAGAGAGATGTASLSAQLLVKEKNGMSLRTLFYLRWGQINDVV